MKEKLLDDLKDKKNKIDTLNGKIEQLSQIILKKNDLFSTNFLLKIFNYHPYIMDFLASLSKFPHSHNIFTTTRNNKFTITSDRYR